MRTEEDRAASAEQGAGSPEKLWALGLALLRAGWQPHASPQLGILEKLQALELALLG